MLRFADSSSVAFQRTDCTIGGIVIDSEMNRSHNGQAELNGLGGRQDAAWSRGFIGLSQASLIDSLRHLLLLWPLS